MTFVERRRHPRAAVDLPAEFRPKPPVEGGVEAGRLMSISEGGCFIQTKVTYPQNSRLAVRFEFEGKKIVVDASVRYSVAFNADVHSAQFPGMGIQFISIPAEVAESIRGYVRKRGQPPFPSRV